MKISILTYHSIDESGSIVSTAPETFRRQMKFLSENDYRVVTLGSLIADLSAKKTLPPKTLALTFDDGFQNFHRAAFPILRQSGFGATVFAVTDFCGKYNDWAGNPPRLPRSRLLDWREIRELSEAGVEFGAHTRTHPDLTRIERRAAEREIGESKSIIEDKIGAAVDVFAYPFGKFNRRIKHFAELYYAAACSVRLGKIGAASDFFALRRIDSYYLANRRIFASLSTGFFDCYLALRQTLRDGKSLIGN